MPAKRKSDISPGAIKLSRYIAQAVDDYRDKHPRLTIGAVLDALDHIYSLLAEAVARQCNDECTDGKIPSRARASRKSA